LNKRTGAPWVLSAQQPHRRTFKPAEVSDTFWHELTHAILHDMNHPLWKNERFVSGFAERLNRAVNSARL
jgi:hypothetical protein